MHILTKKKKFIYFIYVLFIIIIVIFIIYYIIINREISMFFYNLTLKFKCILKQNTMMWLTLAIALIYIGTPIFV